MEGCKEFSVKWSSACPTYLTRDLCNSGTDCIWNRHHSFCFFVGGNLQDEIAPSHPYHHHMHPPNHPSTSTLLPNPPRGPANARFPTNDLLPYIPQEDTFITDPVSMFYDEFIGSICLFQFTFHSLF